VQVGHYYPLAGGRAWIIVIKGINSCKVLDKAGWLWQDGFGRMGMAGWVRQDGYGRMGMAGWGRGYLKGGRG
jgi:hypothetical protein